MAPAVRWGLVGCGDIAKKRVAAALRDSKGSALVAVSRAQAHLAEAFARDHGARLWFADWRDLVSDAAVHAVYLATPVDVHADQAVAAAEAGKHILCEKPMALNAADCDRMIAACRANNVRLGVAYYRHFYPVVQRIVQILASGEIGRPVLAEALAFEWYDPPSDQAGNWRLDRARAGSGPMFDFGCHRIEVLQHVVGHIETASGVLSNGLFTARTVEDTCVAHLRFAGGAVAILAVCHAAQEARDTLDIYGNAGSIHVPVLNEGTLRVVTAGGTREEQWPPHRNTHQPLVEDFVRSIRERRDPAVTGEAGRDVNRVLQAVCASQPVPPAS